MTLTFQKAEGLDFIARFREVVSDPLNLLIERVPDAGYVESGEVVLHNGIRVAAAGEFAYYDDFSQILIINRGVHEPVEEFVFQELLRILPDAPRMIELGAYWGHYSMWLQRARPKANLTLVEPDEKGLAVGQKNFERNGCSGTFIHGFVGTGQFEVDKYLAEIGNPHIDILHSDIQSFELEMLAGASTTLSQRRVDYLFISTHSVELHTGVVEALVAHGYRVEVSCDFDRQTTSWDGFVFASSPDVAPLFASFETYGLEDIFNGTSHRNFAAIFKVIRATRPEWEAPVGG
jgi:Methyltransferase small domain